MYDYFMATWKEDIIKALENLGGKAHLSEIYKEVEKKSTNSIQLLMMTIFAKELNSTR